jgi:hypothetical protein
MEIAEQYITKEFLEGHLKEAVDSFSIRSGSNAGDNYTSILYSIDVVLKSGKELFLLLKVFPYHPARQDFLKMVNIFSKEVSAYSIWIPALQKLDPNFKLPFAPYLGGQAVDFKAPGADKTKTGFLDNYILMTDIRKTHGYTMTDRRKGLDFEHTKLVLKELGKIHAASWVYMQKKGTEVLWGEFPFLKDEMFNDEMAEQFAPMMEGITAQAINHVKDALGNDSPVVAGIETLSDPKYGTERLQKYLAPEGIDEEEVESWMRVQHPRDSNFNTTPWRLACHGDCWVNNMLFRYKNDGNRAIPEEVVLVDLQIYRQACPTTDLAYLLVSSVPFQVRTKHEAEFMEIYYKSFIATCEHFSVAPMPGFTLATLKRRYRRAKIFGFFMGIPLLQIVLKDPVDAVDMDKISGDNMVDMFENMLTQNPKAKKDILLQKQYAGLAQELYDDGII